MKATLADHSPGLTTTLIVLATIGSLTFLVYVAKVNGDAAIALFSAIIGGIISRAGDAAGSKATVDPPPAP